ncbi:MAG TPA: biotin/lipoyl-containing protein, partial [Aggregatilineales bacterium]|nr:biotin/lipoyl-containing protein [Aggregatilineales bacterium]
MSVNIVVPELGESVVEATVGRWLKQEGEAVKVGEPVVELETDKVNLEVGAEKEGVLTRITRQQGEDVKIGDVLGVIDESAQAVQTKPEAQPESVPAPKAPEPIVASAPAAPQQTAPRPEQPQPAADTTRATPIARKVAEDRGVDLSQVAPTGPSSRVMRSDVERYASQGTQRGAIP